MQFSFLAMEGKTMTSVSNSLKRWKFIFVLLNCVWIPTAAIQVDWHRALDSNSWIYNFEEPVGMRSMKVRSNVDGDIPKVPDLAVRRLPSIPATSGSFPAAATSSADPGVSKASGGQSYTILPESAQDQPMAPFFTGEDFTIIALPDSQYYSASYPATYTAQTQWIVDNREARNIVFVTQLGDIVDDDTVNSQWVNADAAYDLLEDPVTTGLTDGIPYGLGVGNHDQEPNGDPGTLASESSTTSNYNSWFGTSRFSGRGYYGGYYGTSNDNHYILFSASGMDFIGLHLEYNQGSTADQISLRQSVLDWADALLKTYSTRRAIITSHYLLNPSGATFTNHGQAIWDALKDNHNLFLMLCGHLDQANRRTDTFTDEYGTTTTYTLVSDYQSRPNGGNGWLRIMTFSPQSDQIHVQTYSPTVGDFINNHADNTAGTAQNDFILAYDMEGTCSTNEECDDGNPCTDDTCNTETHLCEYSNNTDTCDDGDVCTDSDVCADGTCAGTPIADCCDEDADCTSDDNPCTDDCNLITNQCDYLADDTNTCSDGNACTAGDYCSSGSCIAGTPEPGCTPCSSDTDCEDYDDCTVDFCPGGTNTSDLSFDGTNDYVTMGAASGLCAQSFTIECWFKWNGGGNTTTTGTGGIANAIPLVTKGRGEAEGSSVDMNYFLGIDKDTNVLGADFEDYASGANHPIRGTTVITTGSWHHAAMTYDGSCWQLYLDGMPETMSGTVCPNQQPRYDSIQHFGIASAMTSTGAAQGYFPGTIDEVRVWNRVCTEEEITANMYNERVGNSTGLIGLYHFDEGAGYSAYDSTIPAVDGVLTNGPVWQTSDLVDFGIEGRCENRSIASCCTTDVECDDSNPCTDDSCNLATNECEHSNNADPCDDANICTESDVCSGGTCAGTPIANCCESDTECDDSNPCTTDSCNLGTNRCENTPIPDCFQCLSDDNCDDLDECTTDHCDTNRYALDFDGTNDYVTMGTALGLGAAQFTLEAWINWDGTGVVANTGTCGFSTNTGGGGSGGAIPIVTKGCGEADGSNLDMNYFMGLKGGILVADFEDTASGLNHAVCGSTTITTDSWHHVAATYDGTQWQLYVDGLAETLGTGCTSCTMSGCPGGTCNVAPGATPRSDSIQHFGVAAAMNSSGTAQGAFSGMIDETRVWNRALSQTEIQTNMNEELLSGSGLIGHWSFNEGTGSAANDSTTPSENGTLTNGPLWENTNLPDIGSDTCIFTPIEGCCNTNEECDDADICTQDTCTDHACSNDPIANCCIDNSQCEDSDPCTTDSCNLGTNQCENTPIPGCSTCDIDDDCDDSDICTTDSCDTNHFALDFDGSNDYVIMGPAPGLGADEFTVECWFKREGNGTQTTTGSGGITDAIPLVTKGRGEGDGGNVDMNYFLGISDGTDVLAADFEEGATGASPGLNHPIRGTTVIQNNQWYHAAVTYGGGCWKVYLGGNLETMSGTECPNQPPRSDSIQQFGIATAITSVNGAGPAGYFDGKIDEARVWNRALSQAEIQANMNVELRSGTGLIGRWGLNEGAGTIAGDSTTPAENGTLTNGPIWENTDLVDTGPHTCMFVPDDTICDDSDPCTTDTCPVGGNQCEHTPLPGCCDADGDCDDSNTCTNDFCPIGTNTSDLQFDGSNDYVTMGTAPGLGAAQFTLECWFKRLSTGVGVGTGTGGIDSAVPLVTKGRGEEDASNKDMNYFFGIRTSSNVLAADFEEGLGGTTLGLNHPIYGTTAIQNNRWYHAAVTYDGSCWKLYLDGNLETMTGTVCPNQPPRSDSIQHSGIATAMTSTGGASGYFGGKIDEARIWNRALTQGEIRANMNRELTAGTGLIGRWGFNEGSGTTANDSVASPSYENGTLMNGPVWQTTDLVDFGTANVCENLALPNGTTCDDGTVCTTGDTCQAGVCSGAALDCDDDDLCTTDSCDSVSGCQYTAVTCNDDNVCTDDSCLPLTGCVYNNNTASCNDDDACTTNDTCSGGVCIGGPPPPDPERMTGLYFDADKETIHWSVEIHSDRYDVVKGNLSILRSSGGDFASSLTECHEDDSLDTLTSDSVEPGTEDGIYYLVRGQNDCAYGTYNTEETGQVADRDAEIEASGNACP